MSGRDAWRAICQDATSDLISFGNVSDLTDLPRPQQDVVETSRVRLAEKLLRRSWPADAALVWHIGLLKLLPLLRGFNGRVVLYLHGIELWRPQSWLTRRLLQRVDLFLSNSDYTWERFLEHAPFLRERKHVTVPLGTGEPVCHQTPGPHSIPSAVIVSRLVKTEGYKGHRELISAWPGVLTTVPDATLEILGDGDLKAELEEAVKRSGLSDRVRFHGRVGESRKTELLVAARSLVMPSRGEGFGLVYTEAMRLGRPCLVSTCDAGREVVNPPEAGLAVDPGNRASLQGALIRLLTPGAEWDKWSAAARGRYEKFYTADKYRSRLREAICGLLVQSDLRIAKGSRHVGMGSFTDPQ